MIKRRPTFSRLKDTYLFAEIARHQTQFLKKNPTIELISLGVGDTIGPLTPHLTSALKKGAEEMGTLKGYLGYGPSQGLYSLREKIAHKLYQDTISPDEIFISDGAKCDMGRLQTLFGHEVGVGLQDPTYPMYYDATLLQGVKKIHFLPCIPKNNFFPNLNQVPPLDLLYICNPNNPTGTAYTYTQLETLIAFAKKNHCLILYDGVYSRYIQDRSRPRSIFDLPGGREVGIEVNSFSKTAGFSGIRLGWTVVPKGLTFKCGSSIWKDWLRLSSTIFNGASILSQKGALATFEELGKKEVEERIKGYLDNASLLKKGLIKQGYTVYGGDHAPYLWVHTPKQKSWEVFEHFLKVKHLLIVPGVGYGPSGEHFFRVSAFAHPHQVKEALRRLEWK